MENSWRCCWVQNFCALFASCLLKASDMGVCWILQELEHIVGLPSLPELARLHSLPSFEPACFIEDALSSPDTAVPVGERAAGDKGLTMAEQSALVRQTEGTAALAQSPLLAASQAISSP